jgi:2-amino-4-hydroxy-6-hydroxymethyldihydropteridine diphosphokinase
MTDAARSYVIGLGANLGERLQALESALAALGQVGAVRAISAIYETAALGPPQPDYLNAAVLLESALEPPSLLEELLAIERAHGRERLERWGPRTLDLDVLYAGDLVVDEPRLTVPHPELERRAFALMPLLDLVPEARDPRSGSSYAELLARLEVRDVRRLQTPPGWSRPDSHVSLQGERNTSRV